MDRRQRFAKPSSPGPSEALLAFLFVHIAKPEFTVRWRWKLGDVAFWDNRMSTHYATLDYLPASSNDDPPQFSATARANN